MGYFVDVIRGYERGRCPAELSIPFPYWKDIHKVIPMMDMREGNYIFYSDWIIAGGVMSVTKEVGLPHS